MQCAASHPSSSRGARVCLALIAALSAAVCWAQSPPDFVETDVARPDGDPWSEAVGLAFSESGRLFVWERGGVVWIVDEQNPVAAPFLDIHDEVGAWDDHGMLGFALDPEFESTGHVYLFYVVDAHHLANCTESASGTGAAQCGPGYDAEANDYFGATIGRLTRYTALLPAGESDYRNARSFDPQSRKVLIGETIASGLVITHASHGIGSVVFGTDGTLLLSTGDGGRPDGDAGNDPQSNFQQALDAGIMRPEENVGAYRAQLVDSLSGKILRIDAETGDGVPSNPFYDAAAPRAPRSRVWALGMRNPFRMTLRPESGAHDPAAASPGVLLVGNAGWRSWEELEIVDAPGQNFGWPVFEGLEPTVGYDDGSTENRDAPNPLFGSSGCAQQFFRFTDLLQQDSEGAAPFFPNPCDASQPIPASVPTFVHRRPRLEWADNGPARTGIFVDGQAAAIEIDDPASPLSGQSFGGSTSIGGTWYHGHDFPPEYHDTYFHGDYVGEWIRNLRFDQQGTLTAVVPFAANAGGVVAIATSPARGGLYYISWTAFVKRIDYAPGGNFAPTAVVAADRTFGGSPLTVLFDATGSSDRNGTIATYSWDFGDGSPLGTGVRPSHTFTAASSAPISYTVRLTVTDDLGATDETTLLVSLNNTPPTVEILSPFDGSTYPLTADTPYQLIADIRDAEQPANISCRWEVVLHHNTHSHSQPPDTNCRSATVLQSLGCDGDDYYYRVRLTVTDTLGSSASDEVTLAPFCGSGNMPPVANGDLAEVSPGQSVTIAVLANDVDDAGLDPASVAIATAPSVGTITAVDAATGAITYRHGGSSGSFVTFLYTVADRAGARSNAATVRVELDATTVGNRPPALVTPIPNQQAVAGQPFTLNVADYFADLDPHDALTFAAAGLPASLGIGANGVISGTPTPDEIGGAPRTIEITARDSAGLTVSDTFELAVLAPVGASLSVEVTVTPRPALRGEPTRWRIAVDNAGPESATAVVLAGTVHGEGVSWSSLGATPCNIDRSSSPATFSCAVGDLAARASRIVELEATSPAAGEVLLVARTATASVELNLTDNATARELGVAERFSLGPAQVLGGASARAVAAGDVNGDGWPDAAVATVGGQPTEIYLNDGAGAFLATPLSLQADDSYDAALIDLDRDGDLDLVLANALGNRVLFNNGAGAFESRLILGAGASRGLAAVDLDHDTAVDLVFATSSGAVVYRNDGLGAFSLAAELGRADAQAVAAVDVDADGLHDLVVANRDGADVLYLNRSSGGALAWSAPVALPSSNSVAVAAGDYDGNGRPDLLLGKTLTTQPPVVPEKWLLRNDGGGGFSAVRRFGVTSVRDLETSDFDQDTQAEWWVASGGGTIQRYTTDGNSLALTAEQLAVPNATALARGDLDRDGFDDLLVAAGTSAGVHVFRNDGSGGLGRRDRTPPTITTLGAANVTVQRNAGYVDAGATATDDFDGDLTSRIVVDNRVNTATAGVYTVTYTVSDLSGNRSSAVRTVTVVENGGNTNGGGGGGDGLELLILVTLAAALRRRRGLDVNPPVARRPTRARR